ncbi:MAG TPA: bifunctional phosphopantothenoylcysteine decarboxylase/phosphopantothenate--cysteine ligase CoaBC [Terracidiphilus sp.]|jgi:phosphopantothenoylcysteine decarboxylase/phosphopantothenate--cysteine ligase|nr:bifunctional phosphopantothenoylcysteine decarboxylase/phosphopantothenate--cysteine ligase CoaBC [Terracidiphilus sp.]
MRVTVGVSGGIAAYKAAELVRALQKMAVEVHVVMTESATRFVQPLTFAALTGHRVITGLWDEVDSEEGSDDSSIEHIGEAQWTEALIVAPATANILAKFVHGIADNFLTTMYLATQAPVLVAPAMNVNMWNHPATQANVDVLRERGVRVIEPGTGDLACGMVGTGRMAEPAAIADVVLGALGRRNDMAGETVLVTAGGTREALDPVRFIGNRSSGKMGYALADAARSRGARVILVSGPTVLHPPARCELVRVTTAEEMRNAVLDRMKDATLIVKSAAVADYRPVHVAEQKLKRTGPMTLELAPTEDILAEVVRRRRPGQLIVGFAAETENRMENGRAKLLRKGADAIVVNDVSGDGVGIDADNNAATFLTSSTAIDLHEMPKRKLADRIFDEVLTLRRPRPLMVETDESSSTEPSQEQVLNQSETSVGSRRQLIVE